MGGLYFNKPLSCTYRFGGYLRFLLCFFIKDFINASSFINIFYFCQAPTMKCTHYD